MKPETPAISAIVSELHCVDEIQAELGPSVSIFGSARTRNDSKEYASAFKIAQLLAEAGFTVISGGGPGTMRAATEGARAGGGHAVGFNISLPFEPPEIELQHVSLSFENFFTRKLAFARCSDAFVVMPGGMGTLDELFDILTLIQTRKIHHRPVVLFGAEFWIGLIAWLRETVADRQYILSAEADDIALFDDEEAAVVFLSGALSLESPPGTKGIEIPTSA